MAKIHSQLTGNDLHAPKGFEVENGNTVFVLSQSSGILSSSVDLVPDNSVTPRNLGSQTNPWNEIYVSTGSIKFVDPVSQTSIGQISATNGGFDFGNAAITASVIVDSTGQPTAPAGTISSSAQVKENLPSGTISSSAQLSEDFLDEFGDGVISSSAQIESEISGAFDVVSASLSSDIDSLESDLSSVSSSIVSDLSSVSSSVATDINSVESDLSSVSSSIVSDLSNDISGLSSSVATDLDSIDSTLSTIDGALSFSGTTTTTKGHVLPDTTNVYDLGSPSLQFRDLYLSSASLFIDGTPVISTDTDEIIISTSTNQSLKLIEEGSDTITLQSQNGDIIVNTTGNGDIKFQSNPGGNGTIELDAPVQITAGRKILSTDGNAIVFGEDIDIEGDITLNGTVDGVDIANFKSSFDTLEGKALVSSSTQIASQVSGAFDTVSSSIATDINSVESDLSSVSGALATDLTTTDGRIDTLEGKTLVSSSAQVDVTSTTNYSSVVQTTGNQSIGGVKTFTGNNIFNGEQTFNDINVNGTASFAVIQSVTGSAKIIGDAFIVLNNNTPTERYAGIAVYDSGSAGVSASLQFDGQSNDWFYEYSDDGGATNEYGVTLFGPEYNTKGSPTYLTSGSIPKGDGGHHLYDSNITDDDTIITLGIDTVITGGLDVQNTIVGNIVSASAFSGSFVGDGSGLTGLATVLNIDGDSGTDSVDLLTDTLTITGDKGIRVAVTDNTFTVSAPTNTVSQSVQVDHDSTTGFVANEHIDHTAVSITAGNGLTGGGDISQTRDIAVGAGSGITVNANDVALDTANDRNVSHGAVSIIAGDGLTGGGDITESRTLNIGAGTGIDVAADAISVDVSDFMSNGSDNRVLTATGTDAMNAESGLTYDGSTLAVTGAITATGEITAFASDDRLKNRLGSIEGAVEKLSNLNGFYYEWNDTAKSLGLEDEDRKVGLSAQEMNEVLPEVVRPAAVGEDYLTIQYDKVVALLVEGMKEQQEHINQLTARIDELENRGE